MAYVMNNGMNIFLLKILRLASVAAFSVYAAGSQAWEIDKDKPFVSTQAAAPVNVIATVNGMPIKDELLQVLIQSRYNNTNPYDEPGAAPAKEISDSEAKNDRAKLISDLVLTELMAQKARERGIDKRPEVMAEAELLWKTLLQQLLVREYISDIRIEERELTERYQLIKPEKLYHVSHILVQSENEAKKVLSELGKGARFETIARKFTTDKFTKADGDMGWLMLNQMMSAFASSVQMLKPGEYSKEAVNTPSGWHVIRLHATRDLPKTPYAELRGSLRQALLAEKVNDRVAQLSKDANIKVLKK